MYPKVPLHILISYRSPHIKCHNLCRDVMPTWGPKQIEKGWGLGGGGGVYLNTIIMGIGGSGFRGITDIDIMTTRESYC